MRPLARDGEIARAEHVTRKHFHLLRLVLWLVQIPLAVFTDLKASIAYLVFLSLAALVESAGTDFDQARQAEKNS